MTEQMIDFIVTEDPPGPINAPPPGQEAMSFGFGVAAGQDSTIVVHVDQIGRVVVVLAPFGLAVTLEGYMSKLRGWVSLRIVQVPVQKKTHSARQKYDYSVLVNALHQAGFRETIHPVID